MRSRWMWVAVAVLAGCGNGGDGPRDGSVDSGAGDSGSEAGTGPTLSLIAGSASQSGGADGTGAAARFNHPYDVVFDGAGSLYVADSVNETIRKVVLATAAVTTIAGTSPMTGSTDGTGAAARFLGPHGLALDGAGNLYITDYGNNTIRQLVLATGAVTTIAGTAGPPGSVDGTGTAARFSGPIAVALDSGNLYVSDYLNYTIRQVVLTTGAVTTIAGTAGMSGSTDATGAAARFKSPYGLAADGAGNLYVADNDTIRKVVVATGAVTTIAGQAGSSGSTDGIGAAASFSAPAYVALDAGNLYVAEFFNGTIRKVVVATGAVTTVVGVAQQQGVQLGPLPAGLDVPLGVAALPGGGLVITDKDVVLLAQQ